MNFSSQSVSIDGRAPDRAADGLEGLAKNLLVRHVALLDASRLTGPYLSLGDGGQDPSKGEKYWRWRVGSRY